MDPGFATVQPFISSAKSLKDDGENLIIPMSFGPHPEHQLTLHP